MINISKKLLFDLMECNYILGKKEYDNNPGYNNTHFHYKTEVELIKFLQDNDLLDEFLTKIK